MIAEKIKTLRTAKGWSQAELARRLGVTRNGINTWEQGLSTPSIANIAELAKIFSVSTDYLLGVENKSTIDISGIAPEDVALLISIVDKFRSLNNKASKRKKSSKE